MLAVTVPALQSLYAGIRMYIIPVMHCDGVLVESVQHANSQVYHLTLHVHWEINALASCLDGYLHSGQGNKKQQDQAMVHVVQE